MPLTFYSFASASFRLFFKTFYGLEVKGAEYLPSGAALLAANHTSYYDPPLLAGACKEELFFVAKRNLFRFPVFGTLLSWLHAYPVSGDSMDLATVKIILNLLSQGKKVVIFPEGGRSTSDRLNPFKKGVAMLAIKAQVPIIPTYIYGNATVWPRGQRWPRLSGSVGCVFGQPIQVAAIEPQEKKEYQEQLSKEITAAIEGLRK